MNIRRTLSIHPQDRNCAQAVKIREHLLKEFGAVRSCHCGVVSPEYGTVFEVTERLATCGVIKDGGLTEPILEPGIYRVTSIQFRSDYHVLHLHELSTGRDISMFSGSQGSVSYGDESRLAVDPDDTMDWSTIRKPASL